MKRTLLVGLMLCTIISLIAGCLSCSRSEPAAIPSAPRLTNNPNWDIIATNERPLLTFFNASGGVGDRTYTIQIDEVDTFDSSALVQYKDVPEEHEYITSKRVEEEDALQDETRYLWRVRAVDSKGHEGPWALSRFFLDTESDDSFMNLIRIPVQQVTVSSSQNPKNIIDYDDPGQTTFWQAAPPGDLVPWVEFDLGQTWTVSRIWMLSSLSDRDGWLKDFAWQRSVDGQTWLDIQGASTTGNDTYRNIIDFPPATARYLRLSIYDWYGYAPQINEITLYSPGKPPIPLAPQNDYVLIVGNQADGFTFTQLAKFVEGLGLGLETLTVPHYEVSMEMIDGLARKPIAIILSGNNASYKGSPMFEFNGEFEIIRECNIPLLGICCGHQLTVMAYGYTFVRSMGWLDITSMEDPKQITSIDIDKDIPIFDGVPDPFTAPEIHGWAVAVLPEHYQVTASSTYVQALRSTSKILYGEQFHAEITSPHNQAKPYLVNFLEMAMEHSP